jgi:hypothetical protein
MKLVGERRAIAAAVLGAAFLYYLLSVLAGAVAPGSAEILAIAFAAGYGLSFLALVAGYKLARPIGLAMLAIGAARAGYALLPGVDETALAALAIHGAGMLALLGKDDLAYIRIVGERRAVASIVLAFYGLLYAGVAFLVGDPIAPMFFALAAVYAFAFFALVAGYFWARWFGVGVLMFGVLQGVLGLWSLGPEPIILFMAITHVVAALALWGSAMAVPYDGQTAWRERFHMDDNAVQRLGHSVIRAGLSLPMVLLYAFQPKPEPEWLALAVVALAAGGLAAVIRLRTWGVLALAASGGLLLAIGGEHGLVGELDLAPLLGGGLLVAAALPFGRAIAAHLRAPAHQL